MFADRRAARQDKLRPDEMHRRAAEKRREAPSNAENAEKEGREDAKRRRIAKKGKRKENSTEFLRDSSSLRVFVT
jgi:hypothetical protein